MRHRRLKPGNQAPSFTLPSITNTTFSLSDLKGRKVLLILNRWMNCPFCSLALMQIAHQSSRLKLLGVEVVMVFPSSIDRINRNLPKLDSGSIHFLSDESLTVYKLYQAEASFKGEIATLLDLPNLMKALKHLKADSILFDGKLNQLPCSFLINEDLTLFEVKYGRTFSDVIDFNRVEQWATELKTKQERFQYYLDSIQEGN